MMRLYNALVGLPSVQVPAIQKGQCGLGGEQPHQSLKGLSCEDSKVQYRRHFFTQRVLRAWKALPGYAGDAESFGSLRYFKTLDITGAIVNIALFKNKIVQMSFYLLLKWKVPNQVQ